MSDTTRDLLVRGIAAAKSGDAKETIFYLEWLIRLEPSMEERKEAWFWLSKMSSDPAVKRRYLEDILVTDLWDARARRELAILDGKLKESDIIDPNRLAQTDSGEQPASADRFTCPQCGGRMTFTPSGQSLTCEYCDSQQRLTLNRAAPDESDGADFIIGLATARGHLKPATVHTVTCKGCGASLILPAHHLTQNCPYCQSSYVLTQVTTTETIQPDAVIPFHINEAQVKLALRSWFVKHRLASSARISRPHGVYLPVWLFNMGGQIRLQYEQMVSRDEWTAVDDARIVQLQDLLVPATRRFPQELEPVFQSFDLSTRAAFDPYYLADWPAETYQISMSDASLEARRMAYTAEKQRILNTLEGRFREVRFSSAAMQVESYQFMLVPVWVVAYQVDGKTCTLLLNGADAAIFAQKPEQEGWLARFRTIKT